MIAASFVSSVPLLKAGAGLAAGALLGVWHFETLRWSVGLLAAGRALALIGLQLLRLVLLGVAFALIARGFGALPLIAATGGLLLARTIVLRREVAR